MHVLGQSRLFWICTFFLYILGFTKGVQVSVGSKASMGLGSEERRIAFETKHQVTVKAFGAWGNGPWA
jgi:hypothetical protein